MPIALDAAEQLLKFVGFHRLKKESTSDVPKQMFLVASIADGQDDDSIRGAAAANDARNSVDDRNGTLHVSVRLKVIYSGRRGCRIIQRCLRPIGGVPYVP